MPSAQWLVTSLIKVVPPPPFSFSFSFFSSSFSSHVQFSSFFSAFISPLSPPLPPHYFSLFLLVVTQHKLCSHKQYIQVLSSWVPKMQGKFLSSTLWEIHYHKSLPSFIPTPPSHGAWRDGERMTLLLTGSLHSRALGRREEGGGI